MMYLIQIEHPVADFERWKQAFDDDPLGRAVSGVTRYRVYRPIDEPGTVAVDLEFTSQGEAEAFLPRLHEMWQRVQGDLIGSTHARILELLDDKEL